MWSAPSLMNSVYGFKDDDYEYDDEDSKGVKGISKLRREVGELKFELGMFKDEIKELEKYRSAHQTFTEENERAKLENQTFRDEMRISMNDIFRIKSDVGGLNTDVVDLKRDVGRLERYRSGSQTFKVETEKGIRELRSTLIINDLLDNENVIAADVSVRDTFVTQVSWSKGAALFKTFDNLKKLEGNLFHFGKCTKAAHNSEDKVEDVIRDTKIYVLILLKIKIDTIHGRGSIVESHDMVFYLTNNHYEDSRNTILTTTFSIPVLELYTGVGDIYTKIHLVRLRGKLIVNATEDLALHMFSTSCIDFTVMEGSMFTMSEI